MDNVNPTDLLKHLEKESGALTQAHQSVMSELTKLQVEEDILMQTFYNILSAQGLMKTDLSTIDTSAAIRSEEGALFFAFQTYALFTKRRNTVDNSGMDKYQVHEESALKESEQDAHHSNMSGALIIVPEEAGNRVAEGSQIGTDHNQTSFLSLPAAKEDENYS